MITAAAICPAPPLLARELTGIDPLVPELRQACQDATVRLRQSAPDVIIVVGAADQTQVWDPDARLDLAVFAPGIASSGMADLPPPLGLGARLLDQARYEGRRILQAVGHNEPASRCAELGARLADSGERTALLAMADGSARRGPKAPGHLDDRSAAFDAEVERAVRAGDLDALLAIDQGMAQELMATGRPAWQVLCGALHGSTLAIHIRYSDNPFGVAYLVASLDLDRKWKAHDGDQA
jgi:hypothetical protein